MSTDRALEHSITRWMTDDLDAVHVPPGALERVADEVAKTRQLPPRSGAPSRSTLAVAVWAAAASAIALVALIRPTVQPAESLPGGTAVSAAAVHALCESVKDQVPGFVTGEGWPVLRGSYLVDPGDVPAYDAVIGPDEPSAPGTQTPGLVVCLIEGYGDVPAPSRDHRVWMISTYVLREDDPQYALVEPATVPSNAPTKSTSEPASLRVGLRRD
ncbi:MAG: hypothetical protein U0667_12875 [Chloroflexota bacterium]